MRKLLSLIGKFLTGAILATMLMVAFGGTEIVAAQDLCGSISGDFGGFIDCNDQITSFTQFSGGLEPVAATGLDPNLTRTDNARDFIKSIVNFALSFLGLIALVIVIYGGFLYVTDAGAGEQSEKGKKAIMYAIIGILIILSSFAIVNTVLKAPGDIGTSGQPGGPGQTNVQQLANYNSAAEQTKDATLEFIRAYENYFNQSVLLQKIMTYKADKLTTRQDIIDYLQFVRRNLADLERRNGTSEGTANLSQASLAARITIDNVVDPSLQLMEDTIQAETTEEAYVKAYRNGIGSFIDDSRKLVDDVVEGVSSAGTAIKSVFTGGDAGLNKRAEDINCYLPPEFRAADRSFDCKGALESTKTNKGSDIIDSVNAYIEDIVIKNGINVDYNDRLEVIVNSTRDIQDNLLNFGTVQVTPEVDRTFTEVINLLGDARAENIAYQINVGPNEFGSNPNVTASEAFQRTAVVRDLLLKFNDLYELLNNIDFVAAFVTATATRGNAPLVVQFDGSGSYDPADQSLTDENYEWDLDGDGKFGRINPDNVMDCKEEKHAVVTCTYKQPGSYRLALRVTSNRPEQIAPGLAYITVSVQEPVAKIDLKTVIDSEEIVVRSYNASGFIERDIDEVRVTLNEASAGEGMVFDARGTALNSEGKQIVRYSWDFGDRTAKLTGSEQEAGRVAHVYTQNGTYSVVLEVEDETGNKDRKIFRVVVTSLAANLRVSEFRGDLNTEFTFDAGRSKSDGGQITQYNWSIAGVDDLDAENAPTLKHRFESPGTYTVTVQIQDSAGNADTVSTEVLVESQTPKAFFTVEFIPSQPSTVILDASNSYDPDEGDVLSFQWTVFNAREGTDFEVLSGKLKGPRADAEKLKLKFNKQRNYVVELKVADQYEDDRLRKETSLQADVNIQSLVDVTIGTDHQQAAILRDGKADVTLHFVSDFAKTIEVDFGDQSQEAGAFTNGSFKVNHTYTQSGLYRVVAHAFGPEGDENSVTTTVAVGRGDAIIPVVEIDYNGVTYHLDDTLPVISRNQSVKFSAGKSLNSNGTKTGLEYSWNFGDGRFADGAAATHTFTDLAPNPPGYFEVTLQAGNSLGQSETINFNLKVASVPPVIKDIVVTPLVENPVTPFNVRVEAQGAADPDGSIKEYRFYYFSVLDPGRILGTKIVKDPTAELEVDTFGVEGDRNEFAFCVDIKDNEGNTVNCQERFKLEDLPKLTATNGKNDPPVASFVVDRTNVFVGEEINFSSTSSDPDGEIVSYQWDIDGDGSFANDEPKTQSALVQTYTRRSAETGYRVRLKVVDDKGATAISEPVTVFVDSILKAPTAAFTTKITNSKVDFVNNSRADTSKGGELVVNNWDFDLSRDSDGDGDKTNDVDATGATPSHTYVEAGTYQAKLAIADNEGTEDSVINTIIITNVSAAGPAINNGKSAAGLRAVLDTEPAIDPVTDTIYLEGAEANVTFFFDASLGDIKSYIIDRNIFFDTNGGQPNTPGDGIRNNDADFITQNPLVPYTSNFRPEWEPVEVQLTVVDANGNVSQDRVKVTFAKPGLGRATLSNVSSTMLIIILAIVGGLGVLLYVGSLLLYRPKRGKRKLN